MTISTYVELQTAIQDWYKDRADLQPFAADFITLATSYFNLTLRVREMETKTDLTPDADGVCTLPTDYIEAKRVVELASTRRPLEYITEDAADEYYPTRSADLSCHYMILGSSLTALPISANDIELTYYQNIPALSDQNTTNWLLTAHPDIYLAACRYYAYDFIGDTQKMTEQLQTFQALLKSLERSSDRNRWGGPAMYTRPG